jgi:hypothetical protein
MPVAEYVIGCHTSDGENPAVIEFKIRVSWGPSGSLGISLFSRNVGGGHILGTVVPNMTTTSSVGTRTPTRPTGRMPATAGLRMHASVNGCRARTVRSVHDS